MGYKKCAFPGCSSRPGHGKLFKLLPRKPDLRQLWLQNLPNGFRMTDRSTAICEDHFDIFQFEKPRKDGRKKLKESAVPCARSIAPFSCRPPLEDLSNSLNVHQTLSKPDNQTVSAQESIAVDALLHISKCVGTERKYKSSNKAYTHIYEESVSDTLSDSADGSSLTSNDSHGIQPLHSIYNREGNTLILDETTGLFKSSLQPITKDLTENRDVNLSEGVAILDEVTGNFIIPSDWRAVIEGPDHSDVMSMTSEQIIELVMRLREENKQLREVNTKKDKIISDLQMEIVTLKRKTDSQRKRNSRLEEILERGNFSPWLSASQMSRIRRKSNHGVKWDAEDIKTGLILKMKCGTSGYAAFVKQFPLLPSVRSLQESVKCIRFDSGLLNEVFDLLKGMLKDAPETWRDCQLVMDEMAIEAGERYCNSLKTWVGKATLPSHSRTATKALVFFLAGIQRRWKMSVAVYFTHKKGDEAKLQKGKNVTGDAYADIIDNILKKSLEAVANVVGVTSDMGSDNLAMWKSKGITGGRHKDVVSSFRNPACPASKVFVLPDPVHLMRAIKTMMETHNTITLPADIVEKEQLPTAVVDYKHIDDLLEFESGSELKVAFRLRQDNIHCRKHFSKMKMGTSKAVICHRTGVGLMLMAQEKQEPSYETTAWFIILLNVFFELVTARHKGLAVSKFNDDALQKSLHVIKLVDYTFQCMAVGEACDYKPAQRGMRVLCASLQGLIDYFLGERNYYFLLLGRFTSDCIENLFSLVRLSQPIPHAVAFLQILKVITLAQFSEAVKGSSYNYEESDTLSKNLLEEVRHKAQERAMARFPSSQDEIFNSPIKKLQEEDYSNISDWEKMVLYDMAGSVIAAILKSNVSVCDNCIDATKWKGECPHPASIIVKMKEFTMLRPDDGDGISMQVCVSDAVLHAILTAEISFRLYREKTMQFQNADAKEYFVKNLMYVWDGSGIPNCHNLGQKILTTFFDGRLKEFGKIRRESAKTENKSTTVECSSKSAAMHAIADHISVDNAST